jgi:predicted MFS family arabinose efflux permease
MTAGTLPRSLLPAIAAGFVSIGLLFGVSGPLWPDILDAFDASKTSFGVLTGLSLTLSFPVLLLGSRLTGAFGAGLLLVVAIAAIGLVSLGLAGGAGGIIAFGVLLAARGLAVAVVDLAANALTIDAEHATGKHLMGPMHGAFSAGSILGAAVVAIALAAGAGFGSIYVGIAIGMFAIAAALISLHNVQIIFRRRSASAGGMQFRRAAKSRTIQLCAVLTACAFAGEILVADWTSIYLRDDRDLSGQFAAVAIVGFSIAMLLGRLVNGPIIRLVGIRATFVLQGIVTVCGGALIVTEQFDAFAVVGAALAGLGLAGIGPTALSVAGMALPEDAGSAAGFTLAGGYIGLAGTPVLGGLLADNVSTRVTLALVMAFGVAVVIVGRLIEDKTS